MFGIRRTWNAYALLLLVSLCLLCLPAIAQSDKGAVTGSVVDSSGSVLKGAEVDLLPLGATANANEQGQFEMRDIPAGHYTLTTSYVGFQTHNEEIDVVAGKNLNLTEKLDVASANEQINVTGERLHGEAEAINQVRSAENIIDVLPSEVIMSLPNANVADALGRLPGVVLERAEGEGEYVDIRGLDPRLTNITIDGVTIPSPEPTVRQVRLDVINSDMVDQVEINKTLSANQDADGIAGSVNLRTKMANDGTLFSVYANGGYTHILNGRAVDQFGGIFGKRFGAQKKFGFVVGGTYDYNGRGIDNIQPTIDPLSTFASPFYDNITIRQYRYYRTRDGIYGSADYKMNDNNNFYAHGLYSDLQDWGDKWYYEPKSNPITCPGGAATCDPSTYIYPTGDGKKPTFYTSSKRPNAAVSSLSLGGRHVQHSSWFTWEVAAARSYEVDSAGNPKATFSWLGSKSDLSGCNYTPGAPTNTPQFGPCSAAGSPLLNSSLWGLNELVTSKGLSSDLNLSAAASFAKTYDWGGHFGTFEAGFKIRNGHKTQDATETQYDSFGSGAPLMSQVQSGFQNNGNYFFGDYFGGKFGPVSDFNKVVNYVQQNLAGDVDGAATAADTYPNIFHTVERVTAGYVMNTLDFGKLHVQTGVRFEGTQLNTFGYYVTLYNPGDPHCTDPTGCGVASPVSANPSYFDALPSMQLRYSLPGNSDIRAVYSRGVSRPVPYQMVPYVEEDQTASPVAVDIGNPSLRPTHSNNYDLLYEKYLHPLGMIQAGGFFKQLNADEVTITIPGSINPAQLPAGVLPPGLLSAVQQYPGDAITEDINAANAYVYGFEANYVQRWSNLPGVLKGLGLSANYTFTGSQVKALPLRTDSPALQRQTPNAWNISPTYDTKHVSIRAGVQYNGTDIYQYYYISPSLAPGASNPDPVGLGPKGPNGDIYTYGHLQVDAQGSYKFKNGISLMAYGLNLTNEVFGYYQGSTQFVNQREYYAPTFGGGIRYTWQ
jgi:TonB-dependent receptor